MTDDRIAIDLSTNSGTLLHLRFPSSIVPGEHNSFVVTSEGPGGYYAEIILTDEQRRLLAQMLHRTAFVHDSVTLDFTIEHDKLNPNYTIPMILYCPQCTERHIDEQEFAEVAHHTHACQGCGFVWRPAKVNTHGVQFLPGYKNA